jgi:hypothetical protein
MDKQESVVIVSEQGDGTSVITQAHNWSEGKTTRAAELLVSGFAIPCLNTSRYSDKPQGRTTPVVGARKM